MGEPREGQLLEIPQLLGQRRGVLQKAERFVDAPLLLAKSGREAAQDRPSAEDQGLIPHRPGGLLEEVISKIEAPSSTLSVSEDARSLGLEPVPSGARRETLQDRRGKTRQMSRLQGIVG